jgi:ribosome biogenesis protein BMS1
VYGTQSIGDADDAPDDEDEDAEADEDDELFRAKRGTGGGGTTELDTLDTSKRALAVSGATDWTQPESVESVRNRFVTGDWDAAASRANYGGADVPAGSDYDDGDGDDGDVHADFEDLETGQVITGSVAAPAGPDADADKLRLRKAALKAQFDAEHDRGSGRGRGAGDDGGGGGDEPGPRSHTAPAGEEQQETFYDMRKREMAEEQALTREELSKLHPSVRAALEGHTPGAYMRICLERVPCELVQHFDPSVPLLLGGLLPNEQTMVFLQV